MTTQGAAADALVLAFSEYERAWRKLYNAANREFRHAYDIEHRDEIAVYNAAYHAAHAKQVAERDKRNYWADPGKQRKRSAAYHAANADDIRERKRSNYAANRDRELARGKAYNAANKKKIAAYDRARYVENKRKKEANEGRAELQCSEISSDGR